MHVRPFQPHIRRFYRTFGAFDAQSLASMSGPRFVQRVVRLSAGKMRELDAVIRRWLALDET